MLALAIVSLPQCRQPHVHMHCAPFSFVSDTVLMLTHPVLKRNLQLNVAGFCHVAIYTAKLLFHAGCMVSCFGTTN